MQTKCTFQKDAVRLFDNLEYVVTKKTWQLALFKRRRCNFQNLLSWLLLLHG